MSETSAVGNVVDLGAGQVLLPGFIVRNADGLCVDLPALEAPGGVAQFVGRVFASGARFADLDYELFLNLIFLWDMDDIEARLVEFKRKSKLPQLRLARDIVSFPEERRAIYRGVKISSDGKTAEYLFEPISIEREEPDPESPEGAAMRTVMERLTPDFDEFIAALWEKDVRFGINARAVREAIARDKAERLVVAEARQPASGKDASVDEQTDLLHRDDAPRLLANGRMDLRHYRNRFPQVKAGTRLFKKISRLPGRSGWDVQGKELAPAAVKDFDIQTLVGPGTQVIKDAAGEYVVAVQDGFLDIDAQSNQVSVLDKIINREGVSMRTTGDLSLAGDEFEEHGEVQERRVVEGHNMCFLADIFGNIVSDGGRITIKQCISGGTARSPGGIVVVEGSGSRATLEAPGGEVIMDRAESCLVVATRVRIGRAVNCDIVADTAVIEQAEGTAIAAKQVVINNAAARKDDATVVTMLLPDMEAFARGEQALAEARVEAMAGKDKLAREIKAMTEQPDMKSYMTLQPKIKAGSLVMNPKQALQWQELLARLAPTMRQLAARNVAQKEAFERIDDIDAELAASAQARKDALAEVSCAIANVAGDTLVFQMQQSFDAPLLTSFSPKELHKRLRGLGVAGVRLFSDSSGAFEWRPATDEAAPAAEPPQQ